jgi:hypothetical protein
MARIVPGTAVVDETVPVAVTTVMKPELDPRYRLAPALSETTELGRNGRVIAVPGVLLEVGMGTSVRELVLAA